MMPRYSSTKLKLILYFSIKGDFVVCHFETLKLINLTVSTFGVTEQIMMSQCIEMLKLVKLNYTHMTTTHNP